jgi:hypothetical protein
VLRAPDTLPERPPAEDDDDGAGRDEPGE